MSTLTRAVIRGMAAAFALAALSFPVRATPQARIGIDTFRTLAWRNVGPFQGGRTTTVVGIPSQPHVFFAGAANGGVWNTNDAGHTWRPIFDAQSTGAIGSIAISASNPDVMYVGTGETPWSPDASVGNGVYRSDDAGRSWTHLGLFASQHIPAIIIDPRNSNRIFVAVAGRSFGPSAERGVFRSTDGGRSFQKVLFVDDATGGLDLAFDPIDATVVYATLRQFRHTPWGDTVNGPGTGMHKSVDGGTTWRTIGRGLPTFETDGLSRMGMAVAPSNPRRLFAVIEAQSRGGLYQCDDAGETWTLANGNPELRQGDVGSVTVTVDARSADIVYLTGATTRKSMDAGKTFGAWRVNPDGASGQRLWLNPADANIAALASGRGAIVTVNAGETWSSVHNQPTGQFVQVAADSAFPYRICAAARDSPPACIPSRGEDGRIPSVDWRVAGLARDSAVAPDPNDAEVVYSGAVDRYDRRTTQVQDVRPPGAPGGRTVTDAPIVFAPTDSRTLYFATSRVWKTTTAGQIWTPISPDLSRNADTLPRVGRQGMISALRPSPVDGRVIWAGTSDGLIHVTRDAGVTWANVSPPSLVAWAAVAAIEASHFDTNTAYVAINTAGLNDDRPHLWRTRDGGTSWVEIAAGLPGDGAVTAVREDQFRRGLLFAAHAHSVSVSFDDGEHWQSLGLNLPPTAVRDVVIKDADLVAATYGRGFWILDDISVLRQITADVARSDLYLFRPATAWRVRSSAPLSSSILSDEPAGRNPHDGVVLSYLVGANVAGPITLEIIETVSGEVMHRYSSSASVAAGDDQTNNRPTRIPATPGLHRVVWDLKYTPVEGRGMWVLPGTYQVRLTAGARLFRQAVIVRMDPRMRTSATDLAAQLKLSKALQDKRRDVAAARAELRRSSTSVDADSPLRDAAMALDDVFDALQRSDTRPTAAIEMSAAAALERANSSLAALR